MTPRPSPAAVFAATCACVATSAWLAATASSAGAAPPPSRAAVSETASTLAHRRAVATIAALPTRNGGAAVVEWQRDGVLPALVAGLDVVAVGVDGPTRAAAFVAASPALFGAWAADLRAVGARSAHGREVVVFQAYVDRLALLDRNVTLTFGAGDRLLTIVSDLPAMPSESWLAAKPAVTTAMAVATAQAAALAHLASGRAASRRDAGHNAAQSHGNSARPHAVNTAAAAAAMPAAMPAATPVLAAVVTVNRLQRVWRVEVVPVAGAHHLRVLVDADSGAVVSITNRVRN